MHDLSKTPRLIGRVLFAVFLLVVLGSQVVSAQDLPPCTESLSDLPEYAQDNDLVDQDIDIDKDNDGLIEICDLEGLYEMRYALNGSGYRNSTMTTINSTGCSSTCTGFELTRNLSFTSNASYRTPANRMEYTVNNADDTGWEPIGTLNNPFNTRFEGNGHTISNLMINRSTNDIGLFGSISAAADIAHIGLANVRIIRGGRVGSLVGFNAGSITDSYATGSVEGNQQVGGLVGNNGGSVTSSYATSSVSANNDWAGGLVGFNSASITDSYATGSVSGNSFVGGLAGLNTGSIAGSYATGFVKGSTNIGGLVGTSRGSIMNSYATGSVEGNNDVGGLVGVSSEPITNSYATGSVEGNNDVGGLVGFNAGSITDSYATGSNTLVGSNGGMIMNGLKKTLMELRTPTTATGIYSSWSIEVWDFGTRNNLPTLRNVPEIELVRVRAKVFLEGPLQ